MEGKGPKIMMMGMGGIQSMSLEDFIGKNKETNDIPEGVPQDPKEKKIKMKCRGTPNSFTDEQKTKIATRLQGTDMPMILPKVVTDVIFMSSDPDAQIAVLDTTGKVIPDKIRIQLQERQVLIDEIKSKPSYLRDHFLTRRQFEERVQSDWQLLIKKDMDDLKVVFGPETVPEVKIRQIGDLLKSIGRYTRATASKSHMPMMDGLASVIPGFTTKKVEFETDWKRMLYYKNGWCPQYTNETTINFNNQTLLCFVVSWGGSEKCPFQSDEDKGYHGYDYGADDVIITNKTNGKILKYSSLLPHMMKHHYFAEGPLTQYRVDWQDVLDVFGCIPENMDCRIPFHREDLWVHTSSGCRVAPEKLNQATEVLKLSNHNIYIFGNESSMFVDPVARDQPIENSEEILSRYPGLKKSLSDGCCELKKSKNTKIRDYDRFLASFKGMKI